jgi:hypothetical protein|tara:strand:- start:54 stop:242 length:189 start_codon:yes stop_codon:yes gene_type:complete
MHRALNTRGPAHNELLKKSKNITARTSYHSLCLFFVGILRKACAPAGNPLRSYEAVHFAHPC